jgi:hypothetical protein
MPKHKIHDTTYIGDLELLLTRKEKGVQAFYKLPFTISTRIGTAKKLEGVTMLGNPPYTNIICVSEAHTHLEQLVFPAWQFYKDSEPDNLLIGVDFAHVAGVQTLRSEGGTTQYFRSPYFWSRVLRKTRKVDIPTPNPLPMKGAKL